MALNGLCSWWVLSRPRYLVTGTSPFSGCWGFAGLLCVPWGLPCNPNPGYRHVILPARPEWPTSRAGRRCFSRSTSPPKAPVVRLQPVLTPVATGSLAAPAFQVFWNGARAVPPAVSGDRIFLTPAHRCPCLFCLKIYLLFQVALGSSLLSGLCSSCSEQGPLSSCGVQTSHFSGFSVTELRLWVPGLQRSQHASLCSCGRWAL